MYLITPTLLNSFLYYKNYEAEASGEGEEFVSAEQKEAEARQGFLETLMRDEFTPTPSMLKGREFEDDIFRYCKTGNGDGVIREIGDIVKGGEWQARCKKKLDGFLLYAKADVIKRDTIYDIKYTSSYDVGKFYGSMQHRIEFFCTGIPKFSYLISNTRDWWREDYVNHHGVEQEIRLCIREWMSYLERDPEAAELFHSRWKSLS